MTKEPNQRQNKREFKIEDVLPVKAVGIECLRESIPTTMSPHRYIYKWFARRPTAATRLAVLSSILPPEISDDEFLSLMQIGPKHTDQLNGSISDYVIQRRGEWENGKRNGSLVEHYGYEFSHSSSPSETELEEFHSTLRSHWDGELPTVLDPTAGGGTIPLESARYGLPTVSNELNPVAWLLNKVILDYAANIGSVKHELGQWMDDIQSYAEEQVEEYYPRRNGVAPSIYFRTYSISCSSCGKSIPLTKRWWFNQSQNIAARPKWVDGDLRFDCIDMDDYEGDFDPSEGTISGGDAECSHCGVVTERDKVVEKFQNDEFDYEVCAVQFEEEVEGTKYHAPTEEDYQALERAKEKTDSDLQLATILSTERFEGHWDRAYPYGVTQWRDVYSPRQLIAHTALLRGFKNIEPKIRESYDEEHAEALLSILSLIATKLINRNSRLLPLDIRLGSPASMLGNNNFSFQWHFGESNLMAGTYSYRTEADNVLDNYEEVVGFLSHIDGDDIQVNQGDAADLPHDNESIDVAVMDPPYGDNIVYSEVADAFYVWLREYLDETFPSVFSREETNKEDEAVENPEFVIADEGESEDEVARQRYEHKMSDIFSEMYRVLESGGVLTVYFTDKETKAWDSLTMGLINAGFSVSATHTITSEMPHRVGMQGSASADSTLLLTCRKPQKGQEQSDRVPTLWSDIRSQTRDAARQKATEILDSGINLTKTDTIISAFGPTLQVFTENYPVVDRHDEPVRPKRALEEARNAVVEVLVNRELDDSLDDVDNLSTWYILSWLVYERDTIPYDDARQLGLGVGVDIDTIKSETKIWGKSGEKLVLKGQSYRVRDFTALEAGEKRRTRAYPVDPRDESFSHSIDALHAALNVLNTKGSDFTWNWLNERNLQDEPQFRRTVKSLLQVLPESYEDHELLINLVSGDTGDLLDIDANEFTRQDSEKDSRTTLNDF